MSCTDARAGVRRPIRRRPTAILPALVAAISAAAVFMGANTYIGNGPNFMVRTIAEGRGYHMPGFLAYLGIALAVLGPVFLLVTFVLFAG